ncbi:MAG: thioredoxin family protein [Eubacterium sp.]|nr:thioredoxin family protein [Eubacterium sp.]
MGFQLGNIIEKREHGVLHGIQREIACECWFTSSGRSIPKIIKVMDDDGLLHTIRDIELFTTEEKTYCGIRTIEHLCRIRLRGRTGLVKLIYTKESCRWTIIDLS